MPSAPRPAGSPPSHRLGRFWIWLRTVSRRPNVLIILTDQLREPPPYESDELREFRREHCVGQERLRQSGVSFKHHYPMATACAPSRASLLTGQYPSLHGVTQTDGLAKSAESDDMYLARSRYRADAGRLVSRGRLPHVLQGEVARLACASRCPRRRRLPAVDRRRRRADRGEHRGVPEGGPARRLWLLGVGRPRATRPRQTQHGHRQGPIHRRRDDRAAGASRRRGEATSRGSPSARS